MNKQTSYVSRKPDENGLIDYSDEENETWAILYQRQQPLYAKYACQEYIKGHEILSLPCDRIPQLQEVSEKLLSSSGWRVAPVPALISYDRFFKLLANCQFPAATFIRRRDELDYLQEPDIFHEVYGHCPMLTDPVYAGFMEEYGKIGVKANAKDQAMLARLYWFSVEFGLIQQQGKIKAYGAGILSSIGETPYSIESNIPARKPFEPISIFRTPYRIDIFQTVYFVIESYKKLFDLTQQDLIGQINQARELGMFEPTFPPKEP